MSFWNLNFINSHVFTAEMGLMGFKFMAAIGSMIENLDDDKKLTTLIKKIAKKHKQFNIRREHVLVRHT